MIVSDSEPDLMYLKTLTAELMQPVFKIWLKLSGTFVTFARTQAENGHNRPTGEARKEDNRIHP